MRIVYEHCEFITRTIEW